MHHVLRPDIAIADRDVEVLHGRELQCLEPRLQTLLGTVHAGLAESLRQFRLPCIKLLLALLLMEEAADTGARLAGDNEALPLRRRRAATGGHDLDLVPVLQLVPEREQPPVDLGADAGIANLAVYG